MKSKELLLKHLNLNDCKGYVTSDGRLYKAIINALDEAINYTHCCTEVCDCEFERIDSKRIQCIKCEMVQSRDS